MLVSLALAAYGAGLLYGVFGRGLARGPYLSPEQVQREIEGLARAHPESCELTSIGRSTEGRPLSALRFPRRGGASDAATPKLLVTANIHAVEYVGGCVARAVARQLAGGHPLLERAEVWVVPLLNPDGAARIWRRNGRGGVGPMRFSANGVDPNRNFPTAAARAARGMRTASPRPGSTYFRGPYPLSEPECLALARLAKRERFCAAINFHSFGGVVFLPAVEGADAEKAARCFDVFRGFFQSHQRHVPYRAVDEPSHKIGGQLDPFLFDAFGTIAVTVEVSRLDRRLLAPWRLANLFWWANPIDPLRWIENDASAAIAALSELVERSEGAPCRAAFPQIADGI